MPAPGTRPAEDTRTESRLARPWMVVVHDDPVNLMVYVTHVFMRVFGYPRARAERHMLEVHGKGRSVLWTGGREQAEVFVVKLHAAHLRATLEPAEA